jgi:hypothetical protein
MAFLKVVYTLKICHNTKNTWFYVEWCSFCMHLRSLNARFGRALPTVPTGQEAGWALELVWTQRLEEKSFACVGDRTSVVQSVVIHYTD